jgi:UDP-2-acetamido-3-amino-2,3-dideoxy-glucuronate N-acetyltransferase
MGGAVVHATARIGPNCHLLGEVTIEAGVVLQGGVTLIGNITVGRNSIIEPGVCVADACPRPSQTGEADIVHVGPGTHIGAGTILLRGVRIGQRAWIEPGTVVSRNIPAYAIVSGNPAAITGYINDRNIQDRHLSHIVTRLSEPGVHTCDVEGVTLHRFDQIHDLRGDLSVGEFERNVPFRPKRYFIVSNVPSTETRGEHAHKKCCQFLICVTGGLSVVVDDGTRREEVLLDNPTLGLFIPAGIWGIQYKYSRDAVLLVYASDYYDPGDYIRDYDDFLAFRGTLA